MLTADTMTTALIAPAGAGKSHTVGEFARLWTTFTGRRVIGLSTSTNAARVLKKELDDADFAAIAAYDIRGRIRGADEETAYQRAAAAGWPTICKAKTFSCWPRRMRKPPSWPGGTVQARRTRQGRGRQGRPG